MRSSQELMSRIQEALTQVRYDSRPRGLYEPMGYMMNLGGKRIRPLLCLMACDLIDGNALDKAVLPAVGIEMFHNFTLLHDDVMDRSFMRRGKPCVHVKWDENTAVLSGDALQELAYRYVLLAPEYCLKDCLNLFTDTAMEVCEGQAYDMKFETMDTVNKDEYLEMIRLKTAVLLAGSLKMGALIAQASPEWQSCLYDFGIHIGIAFQIKDDILDVWGNPSVFGKALGGDIMCNKKTFPWIFAMEKSDESTRAFLTEYLKRSDVDRSEKVPRVTEIYNRLGVREACEAEMDYHESLAMKALGSLGMPEDKIRPFKELAEEMMKRQM